MDIYGPPENVHSMIMLSNRDGKNQILEGDEKDFDDLLSLISEEIGEGLCTNTKMMTMASKTLMNSK